MDVFALQEAVVGDYARFTRSFSKIRADDIREFLDREYTEGRFWPAPLVQLNPSFVAGRSVGELVAEGLLHPDCSTIFRVGKDKGPGEDLRLHLHQEQAVRIAAAGRSYVLTTGTGSGKSLSYFIPIVDRVLREKGSEPRREPRVSAIVVYPMNALCNSQLEELGKFLPPGAPAGVTFARYTGQESQEERDALARSAPDILLTNYMMLELILTRQNETDRAVVRAANGLRFLVLDELHTYRGRQGADVALLCRRVREALNHGVLTVGTSATMVSDGEADDRQWVVADVAGRLFGTEVRPEHVVTETLARVTPENLALDREKLAGALASQLPASFEALRRHPLAAWVETRLGVEREGGKWVRTRQPRDVEAAAKLLADESGLGADRCLAVLRRFLLLAHATKDDQGRSVFAFRLHQFVSGAGDLFATLEAPGRRYLAVDGQRYAPGSDRAKRLFNLAFCRECGQEYVPVWATLSAGGDPTRIEPRELGDRSSDADDQHHGFFMPDADGIYAVEPIEEAVPDEWLLGDGPAARLKPHHRRNLPRPLRVGPLGRIEEDGLSGWLIPGSFRFCLNCRTYHDPSVRSDLTKLASLSTEGRSSATTVLTIAALRHLLDDATGLSPKARKLLGFTDNRQDASLQAGHFNDFVQILLLRGALLAAMEDATGGMLRDAALTQSVERALRLHPNDYASNPQTKGLAAETTRAALRDVLGYRLYHDLRRGWRITNPNLEQLGLLQLDYLGIDDLAEDVEAWRDGPDPLALAAPATRRAAMRLLLNAMRRQLCIKTRYLDRFEQEQIRSRSHNLLKEPWGLSEDEALEAAAYFVPLPQPPSWRAEAKVVFASLRSRLGRQLAAPKLWEGRGGGGAANALDEDLYRAVVDRLLTAMAQYGLAEPVEIGGLGLGWRVNAEALCWSLRPEAGDDGRAPGTTDNPFFRTLYRNVAGSLRADTRLLHRLEAREHTAQVAAAAREERESRFRTAELPVLFCSPTMELGVDIAELNTVYMRNMPPTPANYAQRSGRAGRSGQAALVLTYAAAKSPHDQYFFRHPVRMVAGVVNPPALDLANEDLVASHLHAVWLAETGQRLGTSVASVVDLERPAELPVLEALRSSMDLPAIRQRALGRCGRILGMLADELDGQAALWFAPDWLLRTINGAWVRFDLSLERWRTLFKATRLQMARAREVMDSAAAAPRERDEAKRRHDEAYTQQKLLLETQSVMNSDFYTYRYLASEGFVPGYNFPRLPLLAFVPARRDRIARDSFLSRPRFLGLAEFGPRSIIYHEGSQYRVFKAILSVRDEDNVTVDARLPVGTCRMCPGCGYGHFGALADGERCSACGDQLDAGLKLKSLYRIENVATRRVTRITSDEEERQRQGYETLTTLQFAQKSGHLQVTRTDVADDEGELLQVQYGPAATVWRVNLGWRRRKEPSIHGFNIDVVTGRWAKDAQAPADTEDNGDSPGKSLPQRIVPYVEDRRNVLLLFPKGGLNKEQMATLQFALKRGIEREFQIEESELVAEPLPRADARNAILFYEAAEGGAGVLTRLALDGEALRRVAARALEVCHWRRNGSRSRVEGLENTDHECEAGCYRCLLSYYNQPEHDLIDRRDKTVLRLLCRLANARATTGTQGRDPDEHDGELRRQCGSSLEHAWLDAVRSRGHRLPDRAQRLLHDHGTRPDFEYVDAQALIYVDGPHHGGDTQKKLDAVISERLEDAGYTVIRFGADRASWPDLFARYPDVFGKGSTA